MCLYINDTGQANNNNNIVQSNWHVVCVQRSHLLLLSCVAYKETLTLGWFPEHQDSSQSHNSFLFYYSNIANLCPVSSRIDVAPLGDSCCKYFLFRYEIKIIKWIINDA